VIASGYVTFYQINTFCVYTYIFSYIDKLYLRPDEKTSRVGFGPRAVVWKPCLIVNGPCRNFDILHPAASIQVRKTTFRKPLLIGVSVWLHMDQIVQLLSYRENNLVVRITLKNYKSILEHALERIKNFCNIYRAKVQTCFVPTRCEQMDCFYLPAMQMLIRIWLFFIQREHSKIEKGYVCMTTRRCSQRGHAPQISILSFCAIIVSVQKDTITRLKFLPSKKFWPGYATVTTQLQVSIKRSTKREIALVLSRNRWHYRFTVMVTYMLITIYVTVLARKIAFYHHWFVTYYKIKSTFRKKLKYFVMLCPLTRKTFWTRPHIVG